MKTVVLTPLKDFARRRLSPCPVLRQLILEEPDQLDAEEFLVKLEMWLKVLEKERPR